MTPPIPRPPAKLRDWLTTSVLPGWAERACLPDGGYLEQCAPDGTPLPRPTRTTLLTARLVYVFSHEHLLDPAGPGLAAAEQGYRFLTQRCADADGIYRHSVTADGQAVDDWSDLYDLAFVLYACAWFARATGGTEPLQRATTVMTFIESHLTADNGGFMEDTRGSLPRRQNPHMHLLEACHALYETSGDQHWLDRANSLVSLLRHHLLVPPVTATPSSPTVPRLVKPDTGVPGEYSTTNRQPTLGRPGHAREPGHNPIHPDATLGEYFGSTWHPAPGRPGQVREPGHHFEWVWLLHHHARLTSDRTVLDLADRFYDFAHSHGLTQSAEGLPLVLDEIDSTGAVLTPTHLLWPQTEALKAEAARYELAGTDSTGRARLDAHVAAIFHYWLNPATGLWVNQLDAHNQPRPGEMPVRILYHITLALAEAARVTQS